MKKAKFCLSLMFLAASAFSFSAVAAEEACPPLAGLGLKPGIEIIEAIRTYTGPDNQSHIEKVELKGETKRFFNNTTVLTQFDLGDPSAVVIVYGHPNAFIPKHPAPYREMFLILEGSSILELADGTKHQFTPGSLFIAEDTTGEGRTGRAGPCGYVALDIQFKPKKPQ